MNQNEHVYSLSINSNSVSSPTTVAQQFAEQEKKADSEFEKQVMKRLMHAGYRVISQWPVGAYRIDLVVEGDGKRLAVECDGDRWHPIEKLEEDMARQTILERLGWRFVRIRGSQFFRNPDQAMEPVFARLRALDIPPQAAQSSIQDFQQQGSALKERIVRRATELRQEWLYEKDKSHSQTHHMSSSMPQPKAFPVQAQSPASKISARPMVQTQHTPTQPPSTLTIAQKEKKYSFNLLTFLTEKKCRIVDKRSSGGRLWVVGGKELDAIMMELRKRGIVFRFVPKGGQSTQYQDGWYADI